MFYLLSHKLQNSFLRFTISNRNSTDISAISVPLIPSAFTGYPGKWAGLAGSHLKQLFVDI